MTSISSLFNKTELTLLHSLKLSLRQTDSPVTALSLTEKDWEQVITLADRHEVLALLTPVLDLDRLSQKQQLMVESKIARTIQTGIQLQALNARLTGLLEKDGIIAVTLKGVSKDTGYGPVCRKSGGCGAGSTDSVRKWIPAFEGMACQPPFCFAF